MPRARKTLSGAKAMGVVDVPGQMYGKGVEQQKLQKAMPAPQAQLPKAVPPQPARQRQAPVAAPAPTAKTPPRDPKDALAAMKGNLGLFTKPTSRPDEPVTAGLKSGPGPGPEVLGMHRINPVGDTLRALSRTIGDPYFAELARKAGM